jgi:hypothetical protein
MTCPIYLALREAYEQALRRWADAMRLPDKEEGTGEAKLLAFAERNGALEEMNSHRKSCAKCREDKGKIIRGKVDW